MTPQNGLTGTSTPGAYSTVLRFRSIHSTRSFAYGNSSGSRPRFGTNPCPAIGSRTIDRANPDFEHVAGSAPRIAIGPLSV